MLRTALALALASCALTPDFPADAAPFDPDVRACDARGEPANLDRLPRHPQLSIALPAAPGAPNGGPWLLTGPADDALLDDLEKLPLTVAHQARSIAVKQRWDGRRLQLEPATALNPGAVYTLALPRKAAMTRQTLGIELHVDDSPQSGAALRSSFPPAESAAVPSDMAFALIGFDGEVQGAEAGIWLENSAGLAVPARVDATPCASFDTAANSCVRVQPDVELESGSRFQLRSGRDLQDAHGATIDELHIAFSTRSGDAIAASWQKRQCDVDERELPIGCVLPTAATLELSLFENPALRVVARLEGQEIAALPVAGASALRFGDLGVSSTYTLEVECIDARLETEVLSWELQTAPALPTLAISEVSPDPNGAEPDQEYVELWNFGEEPASLEGLCLSDSARDLGMALPAASVEPSGRALLVSDAYDPTDARDPTPAPGGLIVRVGKSVTRGGLANSGERLFLRSCEGFRVSSAPAQPAPRRGACLARSAAAQSEWTLSDCTPGS